MGFTLLGGSNPPLSAIFLVDQDQRYGVQLYAGQDSASLLPPAKFHINSVASTANTDNIMKMYKCFATLSFCLILVIFASATTAVASSLPPCSDTGFKHDCFGESRLGDGTVYKGEWKNNKFHGFGTFVFGAETQWAGHTFSGNFKDGTYHGYGIYTFPDGEKYVGDYKEGKKHGFGSYSFANGEKYIGAFA